MAGSKKYQPSARKLKKAREDGDIAKSRDLTLGGSLLLIIAIVIVCLRVIPLEELIASKLSSYKAILKDSAGGNLDVINRELLKSLSWEALMLSLSIGGLVMLSVITLEFFQVGVRISSKGIGFDFKRFNPIKNLGRIFFGNGGEEKSRPEVLFKSLRISLILLSATFCLLTFVYIELPVILNLTEETFRLSLERAVFLLFLPLVSILFIYSLFDYSHQQKLQKERLMMDSNELMREFRESEGCPEQKAQRDSLHQQILSAADISKIRKSKVLITS